VLAVTATCPRDSALEVRINTNDYAISFLRCHRRALVDERGQQS
jgi:hypothetical protein